MRESYESPERLGLLYEAIKARVDFALALTSLGPSSPSSALLCSKLDLMVRYLS